MSLLVQHAIEEKSKAATMNVEKLIRGLKVVVTAPFEIIAGLFNVFKPGIIMGGVILVGWIIHEICRPLFPLMTDDKYDKWFLGIIIVLFYLLLYISKLLSPPLPKKFVVIKGYMNDPSIYVDNKIYHNLKKRPQISKDDREDLDTLFKSIIWQTQEHDKLGWKYCNNGVDELRNIVRKYRIDVDKELIQKVDDCIKVSDFHNTCVLLEVRAILEYQRNSQAQRRADR